VRPAVEAEKAGIPSVVVTLTNFVTVAQLAARAAGIDDLRTAEYPGAIGVHLPEIREKIINVLFDQIIDGLTKPGPGQASRDAGVFDPEEIVCRGSFDDVNRYFKGHEWTDGLPIVPPTRQRIGEFLRYTDRPPLEQVAILPQANLRATPWNIAVNGQGPHRGVCAALFEHIVEIDLVHPGIFDRNTPLDPLHLVVPIGERSGSVLYAGRDGRRCDRNPSRRTVGDVSHLRQRT